MKKLVIFLTIVLTVCCDSNKKTLSKRNQQIELILEKHKRYAFIDFYEKALKIEEIKYKLNKCDSLFDLSSSELYNEYCIQIDFYSTNHPSYVDENYNNLLKKWLKKKYIPYAPTDNPNIKTTMTFKKSLDFYESKDLSNYIDSLRVLFYKKYNDNNLKSIKCLETAE